MTREEFGKTGFKYGMYAIYQGNEYKIASANFIEDLLGLSYYYDDDNDDDILWVRCESVDDIKYS